MALSKLSKKPFFKQKRPQARIRRAWAAIFFIATVPLARAQGQAPSADAALKPVTVNPQTLPPQADVTGFGDLPLRELPVSATVVNRQQLDAIGARRLADLTQLDASVTDAYNAPGYWDFLSIRGFVLDNRFNFRREGLPISAETSIPLDNKERIEILQGTSGIQAGTSAPGGLVNYVVKRPTARDLREVRLEATSRASVLAAADISSRFGNDRAFGLRINAAQERLRPRTDSLDGRRSLLAVAADWRVSPDSLLETELEWSRKSQPSQAAYSLVGNAVPGAVDPRKNLNNQPWSQPSVFGALTGTLRFEQALNSQWRWQAQLGRQQLKTHDRLAFPFGCSAEGNFDRYCSDGTFDFYDFRSENEKRRQDAAAVNLKGKVATGSVSHELSLGLVASKVRNRFDRQAFNYVGSGTVDGSAVVPADAALTDENTNRNERSLEWSAQDAIRWNSRLTTWLGLRHTRLHRDSVRTDGTRPTAYAAALTTPWAAMSLRLGSDAAAAPGTVYASYGEGVESQVVPNRTSQYSNAGVALPALKSKQFEIGIKGGTDAIGWQLAAFQIRRPVSNLDACGRLGTSPCEGSNDGQAVHRGLEAGAQWTQGPWQLGSSATWIDARRRGSTAEPAVNGTRPTNVPRVVLRAQAAYRIAALPGLALQGRVSHEGQRNVLPDGSATLAAWTRLDAALRYESKWGATETVWTLGIDNLLDKRYWKESPTQFGHIYLYPGAPRTLRLGVTASL